MLGLLTKFANDADVLISTNSDSVTYTIGNTSFKVAMGTLVFASITSLLISVVMIVSLWKIFKKAKQPGWASIIPIYNTIVLLRVANRSWWWIFGLMIAPISLILAIVIYYDVAKAFGKGVGMTLLLIFIPIIGWPVLGFGDSKYKKPMHG